MRTKIFALTLSAVLLLSGCADSSSEQVKDTDSTYAAQSETSSSGSSSQPQQTTTEATGTSPQTATASSSGSQTVQTSASSSETSATTTTQSASSPAERKPGKDTTKPVVFISGYSTYHLLGTPFDLNNYVSYGDDTDRHPVLTYEGSVNVNKAGDYPIKATVTDSSGNCEAWKLTVHVVSSLPKPKSANIPSMSFRSFTSKYKAPNARFGLDVSQFQGSIDFNAVKNAGCSFVIVRVGTKFGSPGLDTGFRTNLNNAIAAGLDVGVYLYTTDHTAESARQSAKWIISQLGGKKLDLPVAFDWEELDDFQSLGASISDINIAYAAFKDELSKSGYSSMIYSSKESIEKLWNEPLRNSEPVWLASYTDKPGYSGNYAIWQVCYGNIPGISTVADFNVLFTDKMYK